MYSPKRHDKDANKTRPRYDLEAVINEVDPRKKDKPFADIPLGSTPRMPFHSGQEAGSTVLARKSSPANGALATPALVAQKRPVTNVTPRGSENPLKTES